MRRRSFIEWMIDSSEFAALTYYNGIFNFNVDIDVIGAAHDDIPLTLRDTEFGMLPVRS